MTNIVPDGGGEMMMFAGLAVELLAGDGLD